MNKKRILVVDDEASFTRLLKLNLEQTADYEVKVENRAERALNAAREFRPDLILLDMVMPGMFGGDLAALLRAGSRTTTTSVRSASTAATVTRRSRARRRRACRRHRPA